MERLRKSKFEKTSLRRESTLEEAVSITERVRRMKEEGEPIAVGTGMMYDQSLSTGANPATDIRTCKFDIQEFIMNKAANLRSEMLRRLAGEGKGGGKEDPNQGSESNTEIE